MPAVERDVIQESFSPYRSIGLAGGASIVIVSWCTPKAGKYSLAHKLNVIDLWSPEISVPLVLDCDSVEITIF
jgi:hypothetical protein